MYHLLMIINTNKYFMDNDGNTGYAISEFLYVYVFIVWWIILRLFNGKSMENTHAQKQYTWYMLQMHYHYTDIAYSCMECSTTEFVIVLSEQLRFTLNKRHSCFSFTLICSWNWTKPHTFILLVRLSTNVQCPTFQKHMKNPLNNSI